jgi:hypothetical protein
MLDAPRMTLPEFIAAFLGPSLFSTAYENGFGTLYTAAYHPAEARAEYRWPSFTWPQSFDAFEEGAHEEVLTQWVA